MKMAPSPFATEFPDMPAIDGVRFSAAASGMRYKGRDDVFLAEFAEGTTVAGVLTTNQLPGAPIRWCREQLPFGTTRALVVNAGISNVMTGQAGYDDVVAMASAVAEQLNIAKSEVLVASTGVIGERIKPQAIANVMPELASNLAPENMAQAARAMMTTDTFAKGSVRTATVGDTQVNIVGMIKGSGMIEPNMATMLGYVFTDAKIPANVLQTWLNEALPSSYHAMTVDSDTSTSDMVLAFATGTKDHWEVTDPNDVGWQDFKEKFIEVHQELALLVAKDGEGISKLMTVEVRGAENDAAALKIAKSIANSPLVKTAVAGEDANWGRIAMAVGKSGEKVDPYKTCIWVGQYLIALNGAIYEDYEESDVAAYMKGREITMSVDVGVGAGEAHVWTCDLTHGYIDINADYRS